MKLATLCYIHKAGSTLMLYRNRKPDDTHRGKWNGLGGKLESGETPEACVDREVKEESGLNVESMQLKGILTFPLFDEVDDWYVFVYVINKCNGNLIDSPEGDLAWIPDEELMNLNLWEGDRIFLPWLRQDKFFSGLFEYDSGKLKSWSVEFY